MVFMDTGFISERSLLCSSTDNGRQYVADAKVTTYAHRPYASESYAINADYVYVFLYVFSCRVGTLLDGQQPLIYGPTMGC